MGGDIVASIGVLTIAGLVYRFMAVPPTHRSLAPTTAQTTTQSISSTSIASSTPLLTDATLSTLPSHSTPSSTAAPSTAAYMDTAASTSASPSLPAAFQEGDDLTHPSSNGHIASKTANGSSLLSSAPSSSLTLPTLNPPPTSTGGRYAFIPASPIQGGLGKVALFLAAARALESSLPESTPPLVADPFAAALAGDYGVSLLKAIASASSLPPSTLATRVAVRTRYFDEELIRAVTVPLSRISRYVSPTKIREGKETSLQSSIPTYDASDVVQQVVALSVGSDTRGLRLSLPEYITVYEVDSEETLAFQGGGHQRGHRAAGRGGDAAQ